MLSLKYVLQLLLIFTLLRNEGFIKLAIAFLANAHVLLNITYNAIQDCAAKHYPTIAAQLLGCIDKFQIFYDQAIVFARPVMQKGAVILTDCIETAVRTAPCGLCKASTWVVDVSHVVVKWTMGGAQEALMKKQWGAIQSAVGAYCAKARCT